MSIREKLSGNEAAATALRQMNPDVMAAFPITPSTEIPQYFSKYVSDGRVDTEFVPVESEHSAMSACIGSQAAGARTVTATSANGLALMVEELYIASSSRLPIILSVVNRALSGPININADHSDSMGARDAGWIQLYSEDNQEAYDNLIQAARIGEHKDVQLPVMVCQDGFITSHAIENIQLEEDEDVKEFVGTYNADEHLINKENAIAIGPYDTADYYMEHKYQQNRAMENAKKVIEEVAAEYKELTGREYGFFETYELEDADYALVLINSAAGTAKETIDKMRAEGKKVGLLKIRVFRPFNRDRLVELLKDVKYVAAMDRSETFSTSGGPVYHETAAALYPETTKPEIISYMYGLGGRDVTIESIESVFNDLMEIEETGEVGERYRYLSLRE